MRSWARRVRAGSLRTTLRQCTTSSRLRPALAPTLRQLFAAPTPSQPVRVRGWVRSVRTHKKHVFFEVNDGSMRDNVHIVALSEHLHGLSLETGACVDVAGVLVAAPGRKQAWEVHEPVVRILGRCPSEAYPIHKQGLPLEYLRDYTHLRARTNTFGAVMRLRCAASQAVHRFFQERDFVHVHTPIITTSDCEGAGETFALRAPRTVNFFGAEASLSVSGQLEAEAFAASMARVYTFGPTFRAEEGTSPRHLSEFWMIEPEVAFCDLDDVLALAEDLLVTVVRTLMAEAHDDLAFFHTWISKDTKTLLEKLESSAFVRITYDEAVGLLQEHDKTITWGDDLGREHEKFLADEHFQHAVFVTHWPAHVKPFYMRRADNGKCVHNFDLLVPGVGELMGGSEREERLDVLEATMAVHGMDSTAYEWYLDLRRFGSAPHAGFGVGFERLLLLLTGLKNIRDVMPMPRFPDYAKPRVEQ